jgi:hypothetical protein
VGNTPRSAKNNEIYTDLLTVLAGKPAKFVGGNYERGTHTLIATSKPRPQKNTSAIRLVSRARARHHANHDGN